MQKKPQPDSKKAFKGSKATKELAQAINHAKKIKVIPAQEIAVIQQYKQAKTTIAKPLS